MCLDTGCATCDKTGPTAHRAAFGHLFHENIRVVNSGTPAGGKRGDLSAEFVDRISRMSHRPTTNVCSQSNDRYATMSASTETRKPHC